MAADEVHKGDIGTIFRATIQDGGTAVDVSLASTKQILFLKPDGTTLSKTAAFTSAGTDGKIQYTTITGDLDQAGDWYWQAYVVLAAGSWKSDKKYLKVYDNVV